MTESSPGARAVSAVEISDVFLVESSCHIARDFNQMQAMPIVTFQHRLSPESEGIAQVREDLDSGDEVTVIRYFINGGLRVLRPNATADAASSGDVKADDVLAEIAVKLAVDYVCPKTLLEDRDAIGAFSKNAVFHSWPYWRSVIHSLSDQMRLPRITLPMLRQHAIEPMQSFGDGNSIASSSLPRVERQKNSARPESGRSRFSVSNKTKPTERIPTPASPAMKAKRREAGGPATRRKK
jgi:hypothetical protein